jgi:hypothetical protein
MQWDKAGWRRPTDYTKMMNYSHFVGNIVCTARRAHGVMFGVDPLLDIIKWTDIAPDTSAFAIPTVV